MIKNIRIMLILFLAACVAPKAPPSGKVPFSLIKMNRSVASEQLFFYSMELVGTPYQYGGNDKSGFDCSGMVHYLYGKVTQTQLPRTAAQMASVGKRINLKNLKIGDLVFFNTTGKAHSHVGIYIGGGDFIHAPNSRSKVRTDSLKTGYYSQKFDGARSYFMD